MSATVALKSVGIIGSFKQHYSEVLDALRTLRRIGVEVTTPTGASILKDGVDFVRFQTDSSLHDDSTIQSITLHRLLRSEFVYVVAPDGYIGRTTCYEIGRLLQAKMPLYFSSMPRDIPINLPESHILTLEQLTAGINNNMFTPIWPFHDEGLGLFGDLEKEIICGKYRNI